MFNCSLQHSVLYWWCIAVNSVGMAEGSHTLSLNLVHNVQLLIATLSHCTGWVYSLWLIGTHSHSPTHSLTHSEQVSPVHTTRRPWHLLSTRDQVFWRWSTKGTHSLYTSSGHSEYCWAFLFVSIETVTCWRLSLILVISRSERI